jgi:hypothetical protein
MPRPKTKKTSNPLSVSTTLPSPTSRRNATKGQLAAEINVSIRTIDKWLAARKIPFKRLSARMVRFDLDRVQEALARYTIREVQ